MWEQSAKVICFCVDLGGRDMHRRLNALGQGGHVEGDLGADLVAECGRGVSEQARRGDSEI